MTKKQLIESTSSDFKNQLHEFLTKIFTQLGFDPAQLKSLGNGGQHGIAYLSGNETVIKVTSEQADAELCNKIKGKYLKTLCDVYGVYKLTSTKYEISDLYEYVIVKEYAHPLDKKESEQFFRASNIFRKFNRIRKELWNDQEYIDKFYQQCNADKVNENISKWFIDCIFEMLHNEIWVRDIHQDNIGKRTDGSYILFDLGASTGGLQLKGNSDLEITENLNELKRLQPIDKPKNYDYTELYHKAINKLGYTGAKLNYLDKGKFGVVYTMNYNNKNYTVKFTTDKSDATLCNRIEGKNLKKFCKIYNVNQLAGVGFEEPTYIIIKEYVTKLSSQEYKDFSDGYIKFLDTHGVTQIGKVNNDENVFISNCKESNVPDYVVDWYLEIVREMQANGFFTKDIGAYNIGKGSEGYVVYDMGMSVGGSNLKPEKDLEINEITLNEDIDEFMFDESQHVSIPATEKNVYYNTDDNQYFKEVITKLGYDYTKVHLIGSGSMGIAFKLDNVVIKFTSAKQDAEISFNLINNHSFDNFVCKIYNVYKIDTKKYKVAYNNGPYVIVKEYVPPLNSAYEISFSRLRKINEEVQSLYLSQKLDLDDNIKTECYNNFMTKAQEEKIKPEVINWYLKLNEIMVKNRLFIDDVNYTNVGSGTDGSFVIFDIGSSSGGSQLNKSHDLNIN